MARFMFFLLVGSVSAAVAVFLWTVVAYSLTERVFRVGGFAFRILPDWPLVKREEA